jgi:hypothetical protein
MTLPDRDCHLSGAAAGLVLAVIGGGSILATPALLSQSPSTLSPT